MQMPRVRFTLRRMTIAVAGFAFLLWPLVEHIRWRAEERSDAAERAYYHARIEKTLLGHAAGSGKRAVAYRERAELAHDPDEKAAWSRKASEHELAAAKSHEMARAHTRSKAMYRIGWGTR